ncbi:MAG: hypothetical protein M3P51_09040 [Chloroflexota bacterium]|nr:hypothetical protein [Chloroflexota bacterium]
MAAQKLSTTDRECLLELLASEYDTATVRHLMRQTEHDEDGNPAGPDITRQAIHTYRKRYSLRISELRAERRDAAIERGVANKAERVARLVQHADALERKKWEPDTKGRLWNEKAWRETLRQIAEEKGELKTRLDLGASDGAPIIFNIVRPEVAE